MYICTDSTKKQLRSGRAVNPNARLALTLTPRFIVAQVNMTFTNFLMWRGRRQARRRQLFREVLKCGDGGWYSRWWWLQEVSKYNQRNKNYLVSTNDGHITGCQSKPRRRCVCFSCCVARSEVLPRGNRPRTPKRETETHAVLVVRYRLGRFLWGTACRSRHVKGQRLNRYYRLTRKKNNSTIGNNRNHHPTVHAPDGSGAYTPSTSPADAAAAWGARTVSLGVSQGALGVA